MDKNFSHLLQLGRRGAERRFGELINELRFLFTSFPHLSDAFDADGLPLSFIIKRDARDASGKTSRRHRSASDGGDDHESPATSRTAAPCAVAAIDRLHRFAGRGSRPWLTRRPCSRLDGRESPLAGHRVPRAASARPSAETAACGSP